LVDGVPVPRVSALLDGVASPELERYKRKRLAEKIAQGASYQEATAHAAATLDALASRGTSIHKLIELGEGERLGEVQAAQRFSKDLLGAKGSKREVRLVRLDARGRALYVGTADVIAIERRSGVWAVVDWKGGSVGERPYLRHALQLTAYAAATHWADRRGVLRAFTAGTQPFVGFVVGLHQDGSYRAHRLDLGPLSLIGERLRRAVEALSTVYELRAMYGTGSGIAALVEG
jgi:hypothetical protein